MKIATLNIRLKDMEHVRLEEEQTFLQKFLGTRTYESYKFSKIRQAFFLEKVYSVLKGMKLENIVRLKINGRVVYKDKKHKKDDLYTAIQKGLKAKEKEFYKINLRLEPIKKVGKLVEVNIFNKTEAGELPLSFVLIANGKITKKEMKGFLAKLRDKVCKKFKVSKSGIRFIEDFEDDYSYYDSTSPVIYAAAAGGAAGAAASAAGACSAGAGGAC